MQQFDFVSDTRIKEILERDFAELTICVNSNSDKSVILLAGSIIESVLTEYFLLFKPSGWTDKNLIDISLSELIDLAVEEKVITEKEKNLLSVVKDYKNLLHSSREIRSNEKYDKETSRVAFSVTSMVISSIRDKYLLTNGLTARDIFHKLRSDWNFHSMHSKVIIKLNQKERLDLLKMLVDYEMWQKSSWSCFNAERTYKDKEPSELNNVKKFIQELKPLIPNEDINVYLKKLNDSVDRLDSLKAFGLYNLFHEELGMLPESDQERIVAYVLTILETALENIFVINSERTFCTVGHYIKSHKSIEALIQFLDYCISNFNSSTIENEMELFEQIFNSLTEVARVEVEGYFIDKFYSKLNDAPYDVKVFISEVNKRNLVTLPKKEKMLNVI